MTQQQRGWESLPIIGIKNHGDIPREEGVLRDREEKRREWGGGELAEEGKGSEMGGGDGGKGTVENTHKNEVCIKTL